MQDKNGSKFGEKASDILVCVYIAYHIVQNNQPGLPWQGLKDSTGLCRTTTFSKNCC